MEIGDAKESLKLKEDKRNDITNTFDGLDRGWAWMVMFASFGAFCFMGGSMYAVGIIHSTLLERYHESVTLTSWVGATHSALASAGGKFKHLSSATLMLFNYFYFHKHFIFK